MSAELEALREVLVEAAHRWQAVRAALRTEQEELEARLKKAEVAATRDPSLAEDLAVVAHLVSAWPEQAASMLDEPTRQLDAATRALADALGRVPSTEG